MGKTLYNREIPKLGEYPPNSRAADFPSSGIGRSLFTKVQLKVLGLLFGQPDRLFQMAELISQVNSGVGAVHRVVKRLVRSGLVTESSIGKRKLYQANRNSPVFSEIHSLVLKTVGLTDLIREALLPFDQHILVAFIFGSVASGCDKSSSDVDVLIIGDSRLYAQVLTATHSVENTIGRRISTKLITPEEWCNKVDNQNPFVLNVLSQHKIFLKGSESEFRSIRESC